jgi:oxygen-dependent protoporphyrinogen oxidase
MLAGVYAGSAATIGIRSAVPTVAAQLDIGATSLTDAVLRSLPRVNQGPVFGAIEGGYQTLIDELVRRSRLRWEQIAIDRAVPDDSGWIVRAADGAQWHADGVILAVPAPRLSGLLGDVVPSAAAADGISVASAVVLAMAVRRGRALPEQSGVLVASGESLHAKAITLTSRKWGVDGDVELLRMSFGRFGDDIARLTTDEQLLEWAKSDLATVFGASFDPIDVLIRRWLDAMPQYGPGHAELVAKLRGGLPPTLAVAGNYLDGVGVPACVAVAGRAAASVVEATSRR